MDDDLKIYAPFLQDCLLGLFNEEETGLCVIKIENGTVSTEDHEMSDDTHLVHLLSKQVSSQADKATLEIGYWEHAIGFEDPDEDDRQFMASFAEQMDELSKKFSKDWRTWCFLANYYDSLNIPDRALFAVEETLKLLPHAEQLPQNPPIKSFWIVDDHNRKWAKIIQDLARKGDLLCKELGLKDRGVYFNHLCTYLCPTSGLRKT